MQGFREASSEGGGTMKSLSVNSICIASLLAIFAMPAWLIAQSAPAEEGGSNPTRYTIEDLGVVGANNNQPGQPFVVTNNGWVAGGANVGAALHAVLWRDGAMTDIGDPGLGGNSLAFGVNEQGHTVGEAEDTATGLSTTEDFCGFQAMGYSSSSIPCVPFIWKRGEMFPLKTLGGVNGVANEINSWGTSVGYAENTIADPACTAPQVYEFKPVVWFEDGIFELPTGNNNDKEGIAYSINDLGQVVGGSGSCAPFNPISLYNFQPVHALLWQYGRAIDLGNLGGVLNNFAENINNRGEVVGLSDLPGDQTSHAFLWTPETRKMKDLGTVGEDVWSAAIGINDMGQIVGASLNSDGVVRAFVRQNGALVDLNSLVAGSTPLSLETACHINSKGEIDGIGLDPNTGYIHAYLAKPAR
jgi:probable HAF family extracellular repeat protein